MAIKPSFLRDFFPNKHNEEADSQATKSSNVHNLIENLDQVIFQIDILGRWVFLNKSWETLTNFSIEECLGTNYLNYIHPNDRDICNQSLIGLINQNSNTFNIRSRFLTKDENYFWADIHANKSENDESYIVGSFANVTDQAHEAGLSYASHRSLSTLIDNINGLIYRGRNDHHWSMEYISAGCYKLTGYKPEDLINKSVTFASLIHVDDRENVWNEVQSALNDHAIVELIYRIKTRDGEEKWVWESAQGNFSSSGELLGLEGFITDITSWKKNYIRTLHDGLYVEDTDFPRRRLFMDRLKFAITRSQKIADYNFALFMIQVDRFSIIKNRYDETTCEYVRRQIGELFYKETERLDTICLLKEDVFGILIEHIGSLNQITNFAQNIHNIFTLPIEIEDSNIFLTVSIGITTSSVNYLDPNSMLRDANTALLRAKVLGGACHEIFDERLNIKVSTLYRMEKELLYAVENKEIILHYQPILSLKDNKLTGFEVKLFWNQPRKGIIEIENFISLANEPHIIDYLNTHILDTLKEELKLLNLNEFSSPLLINLKFFGSPKTQQPFIERLRHEVISQLIQPHQFNLLFSATDLTSLVESQQSLLDKIVATTINLCPELDLDDPLDPKVISNEASSIVKINIDEGAGQDNLSQATIKFMHNLGKKVILAKIDSNTSKNNIATLNCDFVQGDFIKKAVDSASIIEMLSSTPSI